MAKMNNIFHFMEATILIDRDFYSSECICNTERMMICADNGFQFTKNFVDISLDFFYEIRVILLKAPHILWIIN